MPKLIKENHHRDKPEQNTALFSQSRYSRRLFLKQVVAIGAAGLTVSGLLTSCGNEQAAERSEAETGSTDKPSLGAATPRECAGNTDLAAADRTARQAVNYVDESPHTNKDCANCRFFKPPAEGAACGGCEIVTGPIAPAGYCNAWVMQS